MTQIDQMEGEAPGHMHGRVLAPHRVDAFARYMPVLLYPEISPIIEKPSNLHEFLKDALELAVLEELQSDLKPIREAGSAAQRQVDAAHANAHAGVQKVGNEELADLLRQAGSTPEDSACRSILSLASSFTGGDEDRALRG